MYWVMLYARDKSDDNDAWVVFLKTNDREEAIEKYADFVRSYGDCGAKLLEEVKTDITVKVEI